MKRTHVMRRLGGALLIGCVLVPAVGIAAEHRGAGRSEARDFGRAHGACLNGRGHTVR